MTTKPKITLLASFLAGQCHFCLKPPRFPALGEDELRHKLVGLRVCGPHLKLLQGNKWSPLKLLAIEGGDVDMSNAEQYVSRTYTPLSSSEQQAGTPLTLAP